jgi:hypothetical protein
MEHGRIQKRTGCKIITEQKLFMEKKTWHERHEASFTLATASQIRLRTNGLVELYHLAKYYRYSVDDFKCVGWMQHWDVYPFILLNLIFSTQAAYAAPIIMMSQNRQNKRDREQAQNDYQTNTEAKKKLRRFNYSSVNWKQKNLIRFWRC